MVALVLFAYFSCRQTNRKRETATPEACTLDGTVYNAESAQWGVLLGTLVMYDILQYRTIALYSHSLSVNNILLLTRGCCERWVATDGGCNYHRME